VRKNNNSLSATARYCALTAIALVCFVVSQSHAKTELEQDIFIPKNAFLLVPAMAVNNLSFVCAYKPRQKLTAHF